MRVGVIMTCFNEGPYIGAAVRSILDQTRADLVSEIFIADDGSDEATLAVLRQIEQWDPRIAIRYGRGNGPSRNRNRIARELTAELVAFLDGDDLWAPTKLEEQVPLLADESVGLCYTGFYVFGGEDLASAQAARLKKLATDRPLAVAYFETDPPVIPSTIVMRRSVYEALGGFDEEIRVFEDTEFCFRAAVITGFAAVDKPLIYKRSHAASTTAKATRLMAHHAFVAFRFAQSYPQVLPRIPRRLSVRASKLGNMALYAGKLDAAALYYRLAFRLNPLNGMALAGLVVTSPLGWPARVGLRPVLRRRAAAFDGVAA